MKGLDVLIVRFLPFLLFIRFGITILLAHKCIDDYPFNLFHSNSAIYASSLFIISLANKRYHCIWNRAMYAFLIVMPIFNYIDAKFNVIPMVETYLIIIHILYCVAAFITAYLAIRHFVQITKRKIINGRK